MKKLPLLWAALCLLVLTASCSKDRDDTITPPQNLEVENFIYDAMNLFYLYQPDVPALADDRFATQDDKDQYLASFDTPEDLFYTGLKAPEPLDRFSIITDDYRQLEKLFAGVTLNNGMDFFLVRESDQNDRVLGVIRYVLPNTSASSEKLERGMLFRTLNGHEMTVVNGGLDQQSIDILGEDSYTIGLAEIDNGSSTLTGTEANLVKQEYTEDPIYIAKTLDVGGKKVGYLMYNSFVANFDEELNTTFGNFKSQGVTDLVLDLRYNGGGSVRTATDLAAMITGQFAGDIFSTAVYNPKVQASYTDEERNNRFNTKITSGTAINSLNLARLYVITSDGTASASELVINGLDAYINVRQVGDTTVGKFQASVTLYDSPNYLRKDANPNHFYALQPLILTTANANGVTGFVNGIDPEIPLIENPSDLGILGDENEPLLKAALDDIRGNRSAQNYYKGNGLKTVGESGMLSPTYQRMYVDLPALQR